MENTKPKSRLKKVLIIIGIIILVIATGIFILLKLTFLKTFPKLKDEPEIGKWYEVEVDGAKSSDGSEWHGIFRKGTGIYEGKKTVYHTGDNNYSAYVEQVRQYIGEPDALLVTGFSAGGFATSLLADDVIDRFHSAKNVTVCVDSSLLIYDGWHETAVNLWKAPTEISDRLTTNNLVLDSLTALHEKRGDSVKILFDCSYRDDTLMQYQSYIDSGKMDKTKEHGDNFQRDLKEMVNGLHTNIPDVGIYIWSCGEDAETHNTQHTIISSNGFDKLGNDRSVGEWIYDAVNGDVKTYGLELLDKSF